MPLWRNWLRWLMPRGIRGKLVALVTIIVVPFLVFEAGSAYYHFQEQLTDEMDAQEDLANALSASFRNHVYDIWATQQALAEGMLTGKPYTPDEIEALLRQQLVQYRTITTFAWLSPEGEIIASTHPEDRGQSVAYREYVQQIRQGKDRVISGVLTSRVTGQPVLKVARGIAHNGTFVGIMMAEVSLIRLRIILEVDAASSFRLAVSDQNGILAYTSGFWAPPGVSLPEDHLARRASAGQGTRGQFTSTTGEELIGAARVVPSLDWVITTSADLRQLRVTAALAAAMELSVAVLIALTSLVAVSLLGRSILAPIRELQEAALSISLGDLSARVPPGGQDEIAEAARAFNIMADRIQDLEHQHIRFLQVAAHELRNPMAGAKAILSMLQHVTQSGQPVADYHKFVGLVEREIDRLSALLDEILHAFTLREGRLDMKREPVALSDVITAALAPFRAGGESHRLTDHGVENSPLQVLGDRNRLEEMVRILVANALLYSQDQVRVTLGSEQDQARISVADKGIGIPQAEIPRVFEHFFRATNLAGRDPGGMGLGLFVAREVILRHGGQIWAESEEERGTRFFVELPLLDPKGE